MAPGRTGGALATVKPDCVSAENRGRAQTPGPPSGSTPPSLLRCAEVFKSFHFSVSRENLHPVSGPAGIGRFICTRSGPEFGTVVVGTPREAGQEGRVLLFSREGQKAFDSVSCPPDGHSCILPMAPRIFAL